MNIYSIDRLNENGGLMYYQIIPFIFVKVKHQNLSDFKIKP